MSTVLGFASFKHQSGRVIKQDMVGQHVAASCMIDPDSSRGLWAFSASHGEHMKTKDNDPIGTTLKKVLGGNGAKKDNHIP